MAFDPSSPAPSLAPETIALLRAAMAQSVLRGAHAEDVGSLLCTAAAEARTKGIEAERLLVILKEIWHSLPEIASTSPLAEQALLQDLISRCIQEYYAL